MGSLGSWVPDCTLPAPTTPVAGPPHISPRVSISQVSSPSHCVSTRKCPASVASLLAWFQCYSSRTRAKVPDRLAGRISPALGLPLLPAHHTSATLTFCRSLSSVLSPGLLTSSVLCLQALPPCTFTWFVTRVSRQPPGMPNPRPSTDGCLSISWGKGSVAAHAWPDRP